MKILIKGEHNFFLFQDIVYYFLLTLKRKWKLPINNKYEHGNCSYYIYDSWYDVLLTKIFNSESTSLSDELINKLNEWMITTNIAILKAQKETKTRNLDRYDEAYLEKYKPYFSIDHIDNYENYVAYIDGDIKKLFLNAISFYESFLKNDYQLIWNELRKYYKLDENEISKELDLMIKNFMVSDFLTKKLECYKVLEE